MVAAGAGTRFGASKQFARLGGRAVVHWAVEAAVASGCQVVAVLPPDTDWDGPPVAATVPGGDTRSASVRAGLAAVDGDADIIVVHDAARPLATPGLFRAVIGAVASGADGAVPALPLSDTIKRVALNTVAGTVDRSGLVAVQTPQAFRAAALLAAHAEGGEATDDAALVEAHGGKVVVVTGEVANLKLTMASDLAVLEALRSAP